MTAQPLHPFGGAAAWPGPGAVPALRASARRLPAMLELSWTLASEGADLETLLRLPPTAPEPRRLDDLWRHTCFEAFVAVAEQEPYLELNLSPSGDWNVYGLEGYRRGLTPLAACTALPARIDLQPRHLALAVTLPLPLPGDLATVILGAGNTPENRKILYAQLGLDKGLIQQYFVWASHVVRGDLGYSFVSSESINGIIWHALPIDIEMIVLAQIVAFGMAIPLAMRASRKPNGFFDRFANGFSFGMLSVPSFIMVVYAVLFISLILQIPNTGPASFTRMPGFGLLFSDPAEYFDTWRLNLLSMLIPTLTGAIGAFVI